MQQGLEVSRLFKVATLLPQHEIGAETQGARQLPNEVAQRRWCQHPGGDQGADQQHGPGRRQQATGPTQEEGGQAKVAAIQSVHDHLGHQVAGDDQEHVDAKETLGQAGHLKVKEQNSQDRDRAEYLDVSALG